MNPTAASTSDFAISSASQSHDEWQMWSERRISGCTPTDSLRRWTARLRWMLELRTVCTLSLNTRNRDITSRMWLWGGYTSCWFDWRSSIWSYRLFGGRRLVRHQINIMRARPWFASRWVDLWKVAWNIADVQTDHGWITIERRDNPNPTLPRRIRPNPHIPRSKQEVFYPILSEFGSHRRRQATYVPISERVKSLTVNLDARRYFKQSEIVLYRQQPEIAAAAGQQTQIAGAPPPDRSQVQQQAAWVSRALALRM